MKLYAQMYSLREDNEKDFEASLKAIAEMGYDGVEFAGYYDMPLSELKPYMEALGLQTLSAHVGLELLQNDLDNQVQILKELGAKYIVCPYTEMNSVESARAFAAILSEIGRKTAAKGLPLLYHNHNHEFLSDQGSTPMEVFFGSVDEGSVQQQPDVFWVQHADVDVYDYLKAHEDRIKIVHLKQMENMESKKNVNASSGIIDFKKVMEIAPNADYVYEQEFSENSVMEDMKKSLEYLKGL